MNAIDLLKAQHEEVTALFKKLGRAARNQKEALFRELADNLAAHASIEEKIFYPAAYAKKTKALLTEAVEEHLAIKRIIADLLEMPSNHDNFDAKVKVLQEQVEHHVDEEEGELFKAARKELEADQLERLGVKMKLLFAQEMKGQPSDAVPEQTSEAAPLR